MRTESVKAAVPPLPAQIQNPHHIFKLLVLYRWLSLVAPLLFILSAPAGAQRQLLALALALVPNLLITLKPQTINRILRQRPVLIAADLLFVAALIAFTGGASSPYYLYALGPLIAAAFFFNLRGALLAAIGLAPLYLIATSLVPPYVGASSASMDVDWLRIASNLVGLFLLSGAFGYAAAVLAQLDATSQDLAATHSDLLVLHEITASLHSADDEGRVQDKLLDALTGQLGFRQVILGLVDEDESVISNWLVRRLGVNPRRSPFEPDNGSRRLTYTARLPLNSGGGLVADALAQGEICKVNEEPCTSDPWLNEQLGMNNCLIVPIRWGLQPVGVLLLDCTGQVPDETRKRSLEAISRQTAVVIGMMRTRSRRARESAIQSERARIALDLHDVLSQSLFGLVFTLDGTLKLLETQPEAVQPELESALRIAEYARQEVRRTVQDMWTEEMTPQRFEADLHTYIGDVLQAHNLALTYDISGDFSTLSPIAWRSLYRIAQEALANAIHHAAASEVRVCLDIADDRARLVLRDNGRGFEPEIALAHVYSGIQSGPRFGLRGMQERARALGGSCDIFSKPGAGTTIVVDIAVKPPSEGASTIKSSREAGSLATMPSSSAQPRHTENADAN